MFSTRILALSLLTLLIPAASASAQRSPIITPPIGSAARRSIMDALRAHLGVESKFQVQHLRMTRRWAYLRAGELADIEGESQETDLSVAALLERETSNGRWTVVESWTLPGEQYQSFQEFTRLVRERQARDTIPAGLFPPEL
ncbi:MAG: hypothetical protein ABI679_06080 [Gemmatimonadota bacterium]